MTKSLAMRLPFLRPTRRTKMSSGLIFLTLARTFMSARNLPSGKTHYVNTLRSRLWRTLVLESKADSSLREIVWGHLNFDSITRHQTDIMLAHPPRNVRDDTMAILQFHLKLRIRQCFHYLTNHFDDFLLTRHKLQLSIIQQTPCIRKGF